MKITKTDLTNLIRDELENFKIVKLSKDEMEQLHKTGQMEKYGVFYQYQEPVEEKIKISKGSGRGQSWTNYDDGKIRMQVSKDGSQYNISAFKIGGNKRLVDLRGLSKQDAAKLVKLAKSSGIEKTAKYGKSKYKKYVSEGKKIVVNTFKDNIKFQLDVEKEARNIIDALKVDKKKLTPKNISDYINAEYKFFKTPQLNLQVFKHIKKNLKKLSETTLKESVWGLPKGSNTTNMDELDAALSRAGIKSIPDFTKLIVQVKGNKSKINKIMKTHKAKKIFEGKRQQLSIPVMDKLKTDKILKKLRLKPGKDYDVGVGSRNSFILDIEGKHLDKLITLLMKQRIRVR